MVSHYIRQESFSNFQVTVSGNLLLGNRISNYRLRKGQGTRDQIANICWIVEKAKEFQKNIYFCFMTTLKPLTVQITTNHGKFLDENTVSPYLFPKTPVCRARSNCQNQTWNNGLVQNWHDKAVYCHPAYLTYMQSTSCEMLGWMNHKLESRLLKETSTTSDMQMIPL